MNRLPVVMQEEDLNALQAAVATLEHPSLAARLGEIAGKPIELLGRALPETASKAIGAATSKALDAALAVASTLCRTSPRLHQAYCTRHWQRRGCGGRLFFRNEIARLGMTTDVTSSTLIEPPPIATEILNNPDDTG
jgi:hypothetical protein